MKMWSIYTYTHTHTHTHTHTMQHCSLIKSEIMPLAATCMDLEITILNEGREAQIPGDTLMCGI